MKNQTIDLQPTANDTTEVLWEKFEKTGSIQAYMLFVQRSESPEIVLSLSPS